jgi:DNA-binding NarL/FixJ family response regulator
MNGVEATMRVLAEHPHIHVVGFTSSGEPGTHQAFLDAGAVTVFSKEQAFELRDFLGVLPQTLPYGPAGGSSFGA